MVTSGLLRSTWAAIAGAGLICGCAEPNREQPTASNREFAIPWRTVTGAWRDEERASLNTPSTTARPTTPNRIQLQYPVGVAAKGNDVYIADAGLQEVLRYDRGRETLTPVARLGSITADATIGLFIAVDQSLYVTDSGQRKVVHMDRLGRERQVFADDANLARPVGVVVVDPIGDVLVADGQYHQVMAFSSLGRPLSVMTFSGAAIPRGLSGLASGPDGLYLADRISRSIFVVAPDGKVRFVLADPSLRSPRAVAVDRDNRVFVADEFDDTIKVFIEGQIAAVIGGSGAGQGRFNRPVSLAVDEGFLYVADSLNARMQIFQIMPEALRSQK